MELVNKLKRKEDHEESNPVTNTQNEPTWNGKNTTNKIATSGIPLTVHKSSSYYYLIGVTGIQNALP